MAKKTEDKPKRPVRIDPRTVIYVDAELSDEEAIRRYKEKHDLSEKSVSEKENSRNAININKGQVGPSGAGYDV